MSQMIESMESRTLFTASAAVVAADYNTLKDAGTRAKADLAAAVVSAASDVKAVKASVAAAHPTSTQKAALATLAKDEKTAAAKEKQALSKILSAGFHDGALLTAALKVLKTKPTNTVARTKARAAVAALGNVFSTQAVSTAESDAAAAVAGVTKDLNAVAAAVPMAQGAVNTTEGHLTTDLTTTLPNDATAIQSAIATLAADLA